MEINSPDQLMGAINLLMLQMNRGQRKQFHNWVKTKINSYNFNYPEGYKIPQPSKETTDASKEAAIAPVIVVPTTEILVPAVNQTDSGIITGQGS